MAANLRGGGPAPGQTPERAIRPLAQTDLSAIVAIDRAVTGRARRAFYERRLANYARKPDAFVALGATLGGKLAGFAFARLYEGEFGGIAPEAALDAIGVDPALRRRGVARDLVAALAAALRIRGCKELSTEVDWDATDLLGFFSHVHFALAPRIVLERSTAERPGE